MVKRLFILMITGTAGMLTGAGAHAQTDSSVLALEGLSLKELLNVKIVSVSKTPESLFEAPLSASVVTKDDIQRNGCTSIMEALRLVPGMIVREQSNGNYDIHLRGMDNVPPAASFDLTSNTTTLVMVNNRPIYSYLRGGTFWETLPIDVNDVEKIEVVRGPAAALYGPNAVNGVINIITRQIAGNGFYGSADSRTGSFQTMINNAAVGYRDGKFSILASGNYQHRERPQTSYFEFNRNTYLNDPDYLIGFANDTIRTVHDMYPDKRLAMEKYGMNVFAGYALNKKATFDLAAGIQHSRAQRVSSENGYTPLSITGSDSRYADFRAHVEGFTAQVSYNTGTQLIEEGMNNKYDFHNIEGNAEYNFTKGRLTIKPGLGFRHAVYDDTKYSDMVNKTGLFNARGVLSSQTAFLRAEYKLLHNKLRLVAGWAVNKFNYPDSLYAATELAATYRLSKKHLVRMVYSKAPRSSNIYDTYVNQNVMYFPTGPKKYFSVVLVGNRNLNLLTAGMFEVGYRGRMAKNLDVDVELFNIQSKNHHLMVAHPVETKLVATDTVEVMNLFATNLPLVLKQQGITVALNWRQGKWQVKPFLTWQHSRMKDFAPAFLMPNVSLTYVNGSTATIYSGMGTRSELKSTPRFFGGGSIDYKCSPLFTIGSSFYYYTGQTYYHYSSLMLNDGVRGIGHIPAKLIVNANISYEPVKGIRMYLSAKNILNQKAAEFYKTDDVPVMFLGGIHYQLNP